MFYISLPNFYQTLCMTSPYMHLNWYDFNQNQFVESYTSLKGINRNLCFLRNLYITCPGETREHLLVRIVVRVCKITSVCLTDSGVLFLL